MTNSYLPIAADIVRNEQKIGDLFFPIYSITHKFQILLQNIDKSS